MVFLTGISFILNLTALIFPVCQRDSFTPSYVALLDDIAVILQKNGGFFFAFCFSSLVLWSRTSDLYEVMPTFSSCLCFYLDK